MTQRADAHIHLFAGGYQDQSFASRAGVAIDEAVCYHSLAVDHGVSAALVVGFSGEDWCTGNNAHLAEQVGLYEWVRPVAYVAIDAPPAIEELQRLAQQGFVGVSLFLFGSEPSRVAELSDDFWSWLQERNWLVSVNSEDDGWRSWHGVLERFPRLRLLVSHLGLPPAAAAAPTAEQAAAALRSVTELARYSRVQVKLSGFYALTSPGHDYPHRAAWPYVEQLLASFGSGRLLWASDFSPCLDWVTFPQTIDLFQKMPFLEEPDVEAVTGGNLLALLDEVRPTATP